MILFGKSGKLIVMKKLVLIDGNSLLNRAFYATPVFSTSSGMPTNAIFGFIKLLFKIRSDIKPDYLVAAFDLKAPTFRHEMYEGYKGTRKPMPDELAVQVEPLKKLLKSMRIATCEKAGIEADDILGTLSKKFDVHSYIYTGDRDCYQLVDDKTDVYFTKRGVADLLKLNKSNFKEQVGLEPCQIVDLKALMGDSSDNIPGVSGIGEKTAHGLLEKYGSLDNIYNHIDELKSAVSSKLSEQKGLAYMSYKLATIDRNCELDVMLENCVSPLKFNSEVRKLFAEFEFRSLLSLDIFEEEQDADNSVNYPQKTICNSVEEISGILTKHNNFAVVLSAASAEIYVNNALFSISITENLLGEGVTENAYADTLRIIFENPLNKVIVFNAKNAMHILADIGVDFKCEFEDLALANYLCNYEAGFLGLKDLCNYYRYDYKFSAFCVEKIFETVHGQLESENILALYNDIEKPLVNVLFDMEKQGVKISFEVLEELLKQFRERADDYRLKIYNACGKEFNINSPMQLGSVLFNELGIKEVKKKNSDKYTTAAEVLENLVDKYPVISDVLKYRFYQKLISTYLEGFKPLADKKSGIIHTTFHQTATTTGRLSSSNPNLQNIPIRDDEGKELRKLFVARDGNVFIDADYSQIELRLLAHFSECKELVEAYRKDEDIHSVTASQVFGVDIKEVTPKMRRAAKAVNFGIIYGISEYGLAKNLKITNSTAKEYIEKYFETYSTVKDFMNKNVEFAKEHGYVSTLTGRKRVIPEIKSSNYNLRQFGERAAMNMPLQGSSADIIKIAMVNVDKALKKEGLKTKIILQVHDELVLEAPEAESNRAAEILKYEMEHAVELKVPLTVEVHVGKSWYEAK